MRVMPHPKYSPDEIVRRGKALYDQRIRDRVEAENRGRFLVINVETGEFVLGDDHLTASDRAAEKYPGAPLYAVRVGYPAVGRIGGRGAVQKR
jgi:hypothetical protein